ncbi:MAG TPA: helix-turn-helix domain-containing protein [Pyrinomonadaceae bacterium]|jgi:DNA-binding HxlR family transcriptional regulator|nr:helix-turn-helix domain-containing protein [Pyrinomonadaceae bacterium]
MKNQSCDKVLLAIRDTMDVLSGKWKIAIIGSLTFGEKRFKELQRDVNGITAKMLSKELKDLEINKLVKRTVFDTKPVTVEYRLTDHGRSLEKIIDELVRWGTLHREKIFGKGSGS